MIIGKFAELFFGAGERYFLIFPGYMIQIFSSYAHDLIVYQNNCLVSGGPAFWIEKVFSVLPVQYVLHTGGTPGLVRIEKDASGDDR